MGNKKNILVITAIFPYPLTSGGAQGQFTMLNELRKEHNVFLMFNQDRMNTMSNMEKLSALWPEVRFIPIRFVWQMFDIRFFLSMVKRGFLTYVFPNCKYLTLDKAVRSISILPSKRLGRLIAKLIDKFSIDIVQTEFYPTIGIVDCLPDNVFKIYVQHEIHFVKNERMFQNMVLSPKQKKKFDKSREYEISKLNSYDSVISLTQVDKDILKRNGVETDIYVSPLAVNAQSGNYFEWNGRLTFVGSNSHIPNREGMSWMIENVFPLLDTSLVTGLDLIGKGWSEIPSSGGLEVNAHGFVEDMTCLLRGSIMVVPILSGSGMRMKILEAAANSVPFVTTTVGVEGLDFINGESCLIADDPYSFARAVNALASDRELCRKIGQSANLIYNSNYTPKALAEVRNRLYLRNPKDTCFLTE